MKTKLIQRLRAALLGLAIACAAGFTPTVSAQTITGTNEIAFTDFDVTAPGWSFGYFYSWNFPGVNTPPNDPQPGTWEYTIGYTDPLLTTGPLVYRYAFTNTPYEGPVTTNSAGYGTGFGMPLNWGFDSTVFNSLALEDYILSWDARVEGLSPGQATANCEMQIKLGTGTLALQKNIGYNPGSNWTHFTYTLDAGGFAESTTYTTFTNGLSLGITTVECAQNQHMPNDQFGFDDTNVVYLDNIKLEVLQYSGPPPPPPPTAPVTILDYNFDDRPLGWFNPTGFNWSQLAPNSMPIPTGNGANPGYGVGGSNAWTLAMDNSALAAPNTPQWAGLGANGSGPANYTPFGTSALSGYRISFDCRVEGLVPDKEQTTGFSHSFFLRAPDDTLQPPDGDTNADDLVRLNFDFTAKTNWQTVSFLLSSGTVGGGSKANVTNHFSQITETMLEWGIQNAASGADWEFDNNNVLVIDNYKLERLYVATPPLNVQIAGNNVVVTWAQPATGSAKLQSSVTVNGTFTDQLGATSPYTNAISGTPKYFRTQWIAP